MLLCLHSLAERLKISVTVATIDHGLRAEARDEALWVKALCDELKLPCELGQVHVPKGPGLSVENEARKARYAFLEELAQKLGATHLATAHHEQDQVETLLWRWITGAPPRAQGGIPLRRRLEEGRLLIRPLLGCSRSLIEDYLERLEVTARFDKSNECLDFLRNRLRLEILPLLRELNPQLDQALLRNGEEARAQQDLIEGLCEAALIDVDMRFEDHRFSMPVSLFEGQPEALCLPMIRRVLEGLKLGPVKRSHVYAVRDLLRGRSHEKRKSRARLSGGWDALLRDGRLCVERRESFVEGDREQKMEEAGEKFCVLKEGEKSSFMGFEFELRRFDRGQGDAIRAPELDPPFQQVWLDGKMCARDLKVRRRSPGDKIRPLGMKAGRQPLKKLFQSRGIPADRRGDIPVITCDDQIVWVVGVEIDERFKLEAQSHAVVEIRCKITRTSRDEPQNSSKSPEINN